MKKSLRITQVLNAYLPPIIWAGLIFFLSAQSKLPSASEPLVDLVFKQSAHVIVYAVLYFLIKRAVYKTQQIKNKLQTKLIIIFIIFLYALSDEFHQFFVVGREATWIDILFDLLGASLASFLLN